MFKEWAVKVGKWWLGLIGVPLDLLAVYGLNLPRLPFGLVTSVGLVLVLIGSFRAYVSLARERDSLNPKVDLTVEFADYPCRMSFGAASGVGIENVWIIDHTNPPMGTDRGILDFELDLSWRGAEWHFDKHPFQQHYVSADRDVQEGYYSVPWQIRKNYRRDLVLVERQSTVIPDQAMHDFRLTIVEMDSGHPFTIAEPGRHRLKLEQDGVASQTSEALQP